MTEPEQPIEPKFMTEPEQPIEPVLPEQLAPETPLITPEQPSETFPTGKMVGYALVLSIVAIFLSLLAIGLVFLPQKHEHSHVEEKPPEIAPCPPTSHNGHLLPLGYKSKIWAEIIVSEKSICAYIVDTSNVNLHSVVDKISICSQQIDENNTMHGVVYEGKNLGGYFCFDLEPVLLLPTENFKTEAKMRVFVHGVPYYATLLECCLKIK